MDNSKKQQPIRIGNATISGMTQEQKELLKVFASRAGTKDNPKGKVTFTLDEFDKIIGGKK